MIHITYREQDDSRRATHSNSLAMWASLTCRPDWIAAAAVGWRLAWVMCWSSCDCSWLGMSCSSDASYCGTIASPSCVAPSRDPSCQSPPEDATWARWSLTIPRWECPRAGFRTILTLVASTFASCPAAQPRHSRHGRGRSSANDRFWCPSSTLGSGSRSPLQAPGAKSSQNAGRTLPIRSKPPRARCFWWPGETRVVAHPLPCTWRHLWAGGHGRTWPASTLPWPTRSRRGHARNRRVCAHSGQRQRCRVPWSAPVAASAEWRGRIDSAKLTSAKIVLWRSLKWLVIVCVDHSDWPRLTICVDCPIVWRWCSASVRGSDGSFRFPWFLFVFSLGWSVQNSIVVRRCVSSWVCFCWFSINNCLQLSV